MTEEVHGDFAQLGTTMSEFESYERCVEGLKIASDGARNLAQYEDPDQWGNMASLFDKARQGVVKLSGSNRVMDAAPSLEVSGETNLTRSECLGRVRNGLRMASGAARQLAVGHRMDLRWSSYANAMDELYEKARVLVEMRAAAAGLIVPPGIRLQ